MGFWNNVLNELDYLGMTNKALAEKAGFDASNIGRGLRLNSSPSVETAVKIAKILNVSVEFLVTGEDSQNAGFTPENLNRLKKYSEIVQKLDALPEKSRNSIINLIKNVSADYSRQ